jgi:peptidoglycan/xylan/chitin deacetylase (PgdA/CDA1 family)
LRERPRGPDRPLAAITFDDGYHDVFTTALPILERLDCPATVFIVSGLVDQARELWWDELAFIFLESHPLPPSLELDRNVGGPLRIATSSPEARLGACHRLRARLRYQPPERIEAELQSLRAWAGVARPARARSRMMSGDEISTLKSGLLTVGAHTRTHPALHRLSYARQLEEIASSRSACETFYGAPVAHFAYPFGDFDGRSIRAAREAGFKSACTTIPGVVTGRAGPYRLPRIDPGRADGESLIASLR